MHEECSWPPDSATFFPRQRSIWDARLDRERYRIMHLLLERIVYDGEKGEIEPQFHALGITRLANEAAMVGQPDEEAA